MLNQKSHQIEIKVAEDVTQIHTDASFQWRESDGGQITKLPEKMSVNYWRRAMIIKRMRQGVEGIVNTRSCSYRAASSEAAEPTLALHSVLKEVIKHHARRKSFVCGNAVM